MIWHLLLAKTLPAFCSKNDFLTGELKSDEIKVTNLTEKTESNIRASERPVKTFMPS